MAGRRAIPPRPQTLAQTPKVDDAKVQRAFDVLQAAVLELQSRRLIELFTETEPGYVPATGGVDSTYFLSADGTWAVPAGGGGGGAVDSVTAGSSMVTCSPTTGAVIVNVVPANFSGIPESGVSGLVADLAGKAALSHTHAEADVTNLTTDLAAKALKTTTIAGTAPIRIDGGASGDLSANRTISVDVFGTAASGIVPASGGGTANYLRADGSWATPPGSVTLPIAESDVTNLTTDLAAKRADSVATARILGRVLAGTGAIQDLTGTQTTTLLDTFTSLLKGLVPASGGGTANYLRADGTFAAPAGSNAYGDFGDGSDGNQTLDGTTTILGMVPVGTTTYTATRDLFFQNLTINGGIILNTGSFGIFINGTLSGSGKIQRNGGNGTSGAAGAAAGANVYGASGAGGTAAGGSSSTAPREFVAGAAAVVAGGTAGNVGTPGNPGVGTGGGGSGGGGGGAVGAGTSSSASGTTSIVSAANGSIRRIHQAISGRSFNGATSVQQYTCGTGGGVGGTGGGSGSSGLGGRGGAGGGYCMVSVRHCSFTGTLEAKGGDGGPGNPATSGTAGGGGGAGAGGGGIVVCIMGDGTLPTLDASGGTGGAGGAGIGGGKDGGKGGDGVAGITISYTLGA
jgi:hypothetical protein